jgi:hypothetical protein
MVRQKKNHQIKVYSYPMSLSIPQTEETKGEDTSQDKEEPEGEEGWHKFEYFTQNA